MNIEEKAALFVGITLLILFSLVFINTILTKYEDTSEGKCNIKCQTYNATFVQYNYGGRAPDECWCRRGNEPLRIY